MGIQLKTDRSFPAAEVERCIREVIRDQAGTQNALRPRTASACEPEIDSLVVVEIICAVEEVLGINLPATFVPRGGYQDVDTCVAGLTAESRAVWIDLVKEEQHHE